MHLRTIGIAALAALTLPTLALASPPEGDADASVSLGASLGDDSGVDADANADTNADTNTEAQPKAKDRGDKKWIKRWAPEAGMGEIGIYGGAFFPSANHELFRPDLDLQRQGFQRLNFVAPEVGLRGGYYPLRFFGIEAEGGVMPTRVAGGDPALLYTVRGQLVAQLGLWSITPFVVLGGGALGVSSERSALGSDVDPSMHFGGGVKFYINRYVMLRLDIRDVISHKRGVDNVFNAHNPEVLLGLSFTLGRKKNQAKPAPVVAGPSDRDGDGILDDQDACPDDAETYNDYQDEDGCPEYDRDGDGIWDDQDACPDEAETVNGYQDEDGCPEFDRDGDGIWDDLDACPDEPETDNGFQDEDGCPDELPDAVKAFTGAIKGITFENNSDAIRPSSTKTLDNAVQVLTDNPDIRIKIMGHTDAKGDRSHNLDLSQRRAEAVKKYFVDHGIAESRMTTEGFGPDKPVDTNNTSAGRANNRRIEFEIIQRAR
jgi:outer membrane protein OmpA-like peptidoglycan-associated protein